MTRLMISLAATAAMAGGFAVLPTAAAAQDAGSQAEVVVYGNDPCPRASDSTIVVCRHRPESERYRLPKNQQTRMVQLKETMMLSPGLRLAVIEFEGQKLLVSVSRSGVTLVDKQQ